MRWDAGDLRRVCALAIAGLGVLTVPACGSDEPAEAEDTTTSTTETTIRRTTSTTTTAVPSTTSAPSTGTQTKRALALNPGDCVVSIPDGEFETVPVDDCSVPHAAEFVGRSLAPSDAHTACTNLFRSYTGTSLDGSGYSVFWIEAASDGPMASTQVVCLAEPAGGGTMTGSLKSG